MSLVKQLWLAISVLILTAFLASLAASLLSAQSYYEDQLSLKNIDSANSLALTLSHTEKETALLRSYLDAQFATGHYQRITLSAVDGQSVELRSDITDHPAPRWFTAVFSLDVPAGVATVSDGWMNYGKLSIESDTTYAQMSLWVTSKRVFLWLALVALLAGLAGSWMVRRISRPLNEVVQQAEAIGEKRFIVSNEPRTTEFRRVVRAMNKLSLRVERILDTEAKNLALVDGTLTVDASAQDRNGNPVSDSATGDVDATAGSLNVTIDSVDNAGQTIDLSGSTTDVAPNNVVAITITDSANNVVNTTATVGADGTYSLTGVDISGLVDGTLTVDASAQDRNGNPVSDSATGDVDATVGGLDVTIDTVDNAGQTIDLSGSTTDVAPNSNVAITITDSANNVVNTTATVGADGSYSLTDVDISGLVDGALTVDASAQDRNGNPVSDSATGDVDATAGSLDVAIDDIDNGAQTIDLSGSTTDVAPNSVVAITITDSANNVVNTTATVGADGTYSLTDVDISALVDGALTVDASAQDRNGNPVSDSATGDVDATAGSLDVVIDAVDNTGQTINLSGSTTDVAPNSTIAITITDSANNVVNTTATVGADGSYSIQGVDISSLDNGPVTVTASATDQNGQPLSDSTSGVIDVNEAPDAIDDTYDSSVVIQGLAGEYYAYSEGTDGGNLSNLAQVEAFAAANQADATFTGTSINYGPVAGDLGGDGNLQTFLKDDADSLSTDPENSSDAIVRMTGNLDLEPGTYQFLVTGDDGYRIQVNGETVAEFDANTGAVPRNGNEFTIDGEGPHTIEIIYWDQGQVAQFLIEIREQGGLFEVFGSQHVSHVTNNPALIVEENQALEISSETLLGNDTDGNGDALTIQSVQDASNGTVALNSDGNIVFTPDDHYSGPATFSYTISDGRGGTDTATVTVEVQPVADAPTLNLMDSISVRAGETTISTGAADQQVNTGAYDSGAGISRSNLEIELGVVNNYLNNRFDPNGPNINDPGTVNIRDGKVTADSQKLIAGTEMSWDYTFTNGEDTASEVSQGFNDLVALVVTAPSGARETLLVDSSENKFPDQSTNGTFTYTATESGHYQFQWLVLNGGDGNKDSSLTLMSPSVSIPGIAGTYGAPVGLTIDASLEDQDGSESLAILIEGVPSDAWLTAGVRNIDGTWSLESDDLEGLQLLPPEGFTGDIELSVTATATESENGNTQSTSDVLTVTVDQTEVTLAGNQSDNNLQGGTTDDLIRGYTGNDTLDGNEGNDYLIGGAGNDTLTGGSGSDVLTGGVGADVFRWELGDADGSSLVQDVVTDFSIDSAGYTGSGDGDQLELTDLLQDASSESISDYLMAQEENGDTVLYVNTEGALGNSVDNASQSIVLSGVSMDGQTSEQFIDSMLSNNQLKIE